ncbi:MAG: 3-isopropylmalate dehydratase large subunit [Candidatus Methylomirabilales bacterium]
MAMTIAEKILARHAGVDHVAPGELIMATVDVALGNDITAPIAIKEFARSGAAAPHAPDRLVLVMDHFTPNKDISSATQVKLVRDFAKRHRLPHFYDVGAMGIEHALLPEQGLVAPGDLVIGADSHTVTYGALGAFATGVGSTDLAGVMITGQIWLRVPETVRLVYRGRLDRWVDGKDLILHTIGDLGVDGARYKAMEFVGEAVDQLGMAARFTMANMAIEAGGKCGIFPPDDRALTYARARVRRPWHPVLGDPEAAVSEVREYDCSRIEPQVALPHSPGNTRPVSQLGTVGIDQAVIGSCTNGRIEDLRLAAAVLRGRKVAPYVRLIVIPATQAVYQQAVREELVDTFLAAGGAVSTPTCGPCMGGSMGVLAQGERAVATTNRNFIGRMGHPESEVYLASPAVAAASAVLGRIAAPSEL